MTSLFEKLGKKIEDIKPEMNLREKEDKEFARRFQMTGEDRYYKEPSFYQSPTVKEAKAKLPSDRIDVPNSYLTKKMKWRTDEEIRSIWEKPVTGDHVLTAYELSRMILMPSLPNRIVLLDSLHSPCRAHNMNFDLDNCGAKPEGTMTKELAKKDFVCKSHVYHLIHCMNKHKNWFDARREEIYKTRKFVAQFIQNSNAPEKEEFLSIWNTHLSEQADTTASYTRPLSSYPKYETPKSL